MTQKDQKKLTAWLAENAMGWRQVALLPHLIGPDTFHVDQVGRISIKGTNAPLRYWDPITNPADALAVLKKCAEKSKRSVCVCVCPEGFEVYLGGGYAKSTVKAPTLELAICRFAYKLFGGKE